jgi:hypothetical protein
MIHFLTNCYLLDSVVLIRFPETNRTITLCYLHFVFLHFTQKMPLIKVLDILEVGSIFFLYGSTALYGPGPPHFVEVLWSHTFEIHHSR